MKKRAGKPAGKPAAASAKKPSPRLSHFDARGNARMVDISGKPETQREAVAEAVVVMADGTWQLVVAGEIPNGDALGAARVAGVMAGKRTPDLIPLCHPLLLSQVDVTFDTFPAEERQINDRHVTSTCDRGSDKDGEQSGS